MNQFVLQMLYKIKYKYKRIKKENNQHSGENRDFPYTSGCIIHPTLIVSRETHNPKCFIFCLKKKKQIHISTIIAGYRLPVRPFTLWSTLNNCESVFTCWISKLVWISGLCSDMMHMIILTQFLLSCVACIVITCTIIMYCDPGCKKDHLVHIDEIFTSLGQTIPS